MAPIPVEELYGEWNGNGCCCTPQMLPREDRQEHVRLLPLLPVPGHLRLRPIVPASLRLGFHAVPVLRESVLQLPDRLHQVHEQLVC